MIFSDLKSNNDIKNIINTLKREFKNLAKLTLPKTYESTMGEKKILTIYHNLQPAMKIEGYEDLLDIFKESLEEEKLNY
ncbi:MAG: hypothetical protein PF693_03840 [Spirochaetia bacterium]|jgi:hypothetical protein|nr:hypothetical protein [Spirochaetia bacterium]